MAWSKMAEVPNPLLDLNGDPASGYVLKAYLSGTTTATPMATDDSGATQVSTMTSNAEGKWEVGGNEVIPHIDRDCKWGIFANASNATANTPFYMGPFDGVDQSANSAESQKVFSTMTEVIASTSLSIGDKVKTSGYYTIGDRGGNDYEIVAAATGTADGGTFIDLATHQAKGLFTSGEFNVKQFGAVGDGTTDDTAPIQAAIDTQDEIGKVRYIGFPHAVYAVTGLNLNSVNATHFKGERDLASATPSSIKYLSSASGTGAVIERSTTSGGLGSSFENLYIDTNETAQYGFYLASGNIFHSIKDMAFKNVDINNLKSSAVGWQLGDQTNTGLDTDAFNFQFNQCRARGTGALGWVVDAQNAYNISWYNCFHSRKDGSNFMLTGIKTIRGSGFRLYNYFGDKLQASGTPWCIDHGSGSLEVYGMNTEDYRVVKARTAGRDEDKLTMHGVSVNDSDGDDEIVVDSTMVTSINDSTFLTGATNRVISCSNPFYGRNIELGPTGKYTLTGRARLNELEGLRVGQLSPLNINPIFEYYTDGTTAATSWRELKGTGTGTISLSGSNNINGTNTTAISCSSANTGDPFGIRFPQNIPIAQFQGQSINLVAFGTRNATETLTMEALIDGSSTGVIGGSTVWEELSSGGKLMAWMRLDVPADAQVITGGSLKAGLSPNETGSVWLDSVCVLPLDFTGMIPALALHMQSLDYDYFRDRPLVSNDNISTLTNSGAINTDAYQTNLVTTGAAAVTLGNGYEGQEMHLVMTLDGGDATVTPSSLGNGTTITFDDVGDNAYLRFLNGAWYFTGGTATLA